jgi:hypothetical protein
MHCFPPTDAGFLSCDMHPRMLIPSTPPSAIITTYGGPAISVIKDARVPQLDDKSYFLMRKISASAVSCGRQISGARLADPDRPSVFGPALIRELMSMPGTLSLIGARIPKSGLLRDGRRDPAPAGMLSDGDMPEYLFRRTGGIVGVLRNSSRKHAGTPSSQASRRSGNRRGPTSRPQARPVVVIGVGQRLGSH